MWQRTTGSSIAEVDGFYLSVWKTYVGSTFWNWDIRDSKGDIIKSSVRNPPERRRIQELAEARVIEVLSGLTLIEWNKTFEWLEGAEWKGVQMNIGSLLGNRQMYRGYADFKNSTFSSNEYDDKEKCRKEVEAWARRMVYGQA